MAQPSQKVFSIGLPKRKIAKVMLGLASLACVPVAAINDAVRIVNSDDDRCASICLDRGKVFCGRTDFQAGYCCGSEGCNEDVRKEAPLCSNDIADEALKYFVCPRVSSCGQKVFKANNQNHIDISVNPFETFLQTGDRCSYLLSVDEYEEGDVIELGAIDSVKMELILFTGGYSLGSAHLETVLENGKRYHMDGTQKLFLMATTIDSQQIGKPYFSLAMKKIPNGILIDEETQSVIETLEDKGILSSKVNANPITIEIENLEVNVTVAELYSNQVDERTKNNEAMETVDVVLLTVMWICLGTAMFLSIFICATISCRRVIVRSFKVANEQMVEPYVVTTDAYNFETNIENAEGPYEAKNKKLSLNKSSKGDEKYVSVKTGGFNSRNIKPNRDLSLGNKRTDMECASQTVEGSVEENENVNAYNTEDALKQEVNPTHAVNPSAFAENNKFDMNSSRTLQEQPKIEQYNFSTPLTRIRGNEFDHNKENFVFTDSKGSITPGSTERQTLTLQQTIMQATYIDETRRTASNTVFEGDSTSKSKNYQALEIDSQENNSGAGTTENRRAKRRKMKKNAGAAQDSDSNPESIKIA